MKFDGETIVAFLVRVLLAAVLLLALIANAISAGEPLDAAADTEQPND